jgi:hypothetical protein
MPSFNYENETSVTKGFNQRCFHHLDTKRPCVSHGSIFSEEVSARHLEQEEHVARIRIMCVYVRKDVPIHNLMKIFDKRN